MVGFTADYSKRLLERETCLRTMWTTFKIMPIHSHTIHNYLLTLNAFKYIGLISVIPSLNGIIRTRGFQSVFSPLAKVSPFDVSLHSRSAMQTNRKLCAVSLLLHIINTNYMSIIHLLTSLVTNKLSKATCKTTEFHSSYAANFLKTIFIVVLAIFNT